MANKRDYAACHAKIRQAHELLKQAAILLGQATHDAPRPIADELEERFMQVNTAWNDLGMLVK